jgi:hypothetical protein
MALFGSWQEQLEDQLSVRVPYLREKLFYFQLLALSAIMLHIQT